MGSTEAIYSGGEISREIFEKEVERLRKKGRVAKNRREKQEEEKVIDLVSRKEDGKCIRISFRCWYIISDQNESCARVECTIFRFENILTQSNQ